MTLNYEAYTVQDKVKSVNMTPVKTLIKKRPQIAMYKQYVVLEQ